MRIPDSLARLVDYGIVQEVVRPLMSGKEAQVYQVIAGGEPRVAKVYKEAQARTFKHRAEYTEGRRTRSSRDQRAIGKRTRHGRSQDEAAWRSTEVDVIHRLRDAGVRVPEPHQFVDGVLVMELVRDAHGDPAPRLGDLVFEPAEALEIYHGLIGQVVRMLCAGVVHGDLSDFNVLMGRNGPVVIDFPQAVDPATNQNARRLLVRDVDNLHRFVARFARQAARPRYAEEMWALYQANRLRPETKLEGGYEAPQEKADTAGVLALIEDAREEERARRAARGDERPVTPPRPHRVVVDVAPAVRSEPRNGSAPATGKTGKAGRTSNTGKTDKTSNTDKTGKTSETGKKRGAGAGTGARPSGKPGRKRARRRRRPAARGPRSSEQ